MIVIRNCILISNITIMRDYCDHSIGIDMFGKNAFTISQCWYIIRPIVRQIVTSVGLDVFFSRLLVFFCHHFASSLLGSTTQTTVPWATLGSRILWIIIQCFLVEKKVGEMEALRRRNLAKVPTSFPPSNSAGSGVVHNSKLRHRLWPVSAFISFSLAIKADILLSGVVDFKQCQFII